MKSRELIACAACVLLAAASITTAQPNCEATSTGAIPVSDLGQNLYLGQFQGGLYPGGLNVPPQPHHQAGVNTARSLLPRTTQGMPSPLGKYVLLSIGYSNTTQEFCCHPGTFMGRAGVDPRVDHNRLVVVNGARGGQAADVWVTPDSAEYDRIRDQQLAPRGLSEAQVGAVWLKVTNRSPSIGLPDENAEAYLLVEQYGDIVRALRIRYPNLRLVFFSTRIYAGYASTPLSPEPYAYESAFGAKWVIAAQINQRAGGGIDPLAGDLSFDVAPLLFWGPYLWADGLTPRSDGLTWACNEFQNDGTHPGPPAQNKVGQMLFDFFLGSPYTRPWFVANGPCPGDYNGDGVRDTSDFFEFFFAFNAQSPEGDYNGDGWLSTADFFEFVGDFFGPPCV